MGRLHRMRWGSLLQEYDDGEAVAARAALMARHLEDCPDCTGELDQLRLLKRSLARVGDRPVDELAMRRLRAHAVHIGS